MSLRKLLPLFLALTIGTISASGQHAAERTFAVKDESSADTAHLDELRVAGFEALYNLDYDAARKNFKEIVRLFPDHPAGPQFLAAALWAQALNESRRLQSSLYNTESFYEQKEDKPDPRMVEEFRSLTRTAAQLAKARLRRNPKDTEALYFLGATEGLKAAFATAVQRSFMSALSDGSSSVDRHRDVIKLDPAFHDAELTIGLYDYVVGSLPGPVKLLAAPLARADESIAATEQQPMLRRPSSVVIRPFGVPDHHITEADVAALDALNRSSRHHVSPVHPE